MDSAKPDVGSNVGGLVRTFAKVLRFKAAGNAPGDEIREIKSQNKPKDASFSRNRFQSLEDVDTFQHRDAMEALLAELFAKISSVKAAYAQLQIAQSPYDPEGIQSTDEKLVDELKCISELKQSFLKKQIDPSLQISLLAEIQKQQSHLKTYEIMVKKFESELKLKDYEITFLREKFEESDKQNKLIEKRLKPKGPLSILDDHLSELNPTHFIEALQIAIKSIRSFVKFLMGEMRLAGWDFDAAASSIEPTAIYAKQSLKRFAFESFVCKEMFDGFQYPNFSLPNESLPEENNKWNNHFFERFTELKCEKTMEFLSERPNCSFGKFCRAKYFHLVHPKMELSFFGDLKQRTMVNSGRYPETSFFAAFAEMAKWVWLLHCLAFSFDLEASIFKVSKGCRFSELYMETLNENQNFSSNKMPLTNPCVEFTVFPGFRIGKTIIKCEVYLSPA